MEGIEWLKIVGTAIAVSCVVLVFVEGKRWRRRLPPGPPAWPIVGNMHLLGTLPHQALASLAAKYGPLMSMRLGSVQTIVVSSPEMAREVLKVQDQVFSSRPTTFAGRVFGYEKADMLWSDIGPRWKLMRKIAQFELLSPSRIASYKHIRSEEVLETLREMLAECKEGRAVALEKKLGEMMLNNITRMTLSKKYFGAAAEASPHAKEISAIITGVFNLSGAFVTGDYIPGLAWLDIGGNEAKIKKLFKKMDAFHTGTVEEHRQNLFRGDANMLPDFVDLLLCLEGEDVLTDNQIKALFGDILFGGAETAANQVLWTLTELMRHPEVRKRAQEELTSVVGTDRLVEESDIPNLTYLQAIVKESFRLHPIGPMLVPHQSNKETTLGGYQIPKNTRVFVNAYAIQRDPATWDRPHEFDPKRFLSSKVDLKGNDFALIPFGAGRRICPGINLGLLMVQYALAQLLHTCDWSLPQGQKPEDIDMAENFGMTLPPLNPLNVVVTPRLPILKI